MDITLEELKTAAETLGYELRRKGRKQEHTAVLGRDGEQLRNCYLPHLAATASVRARTIKVLEEARSRIGAFAGDPYVQWCDIWEVLLLGVEHIMRNLKLKEYGGKKQLEFSLQLLRPLDDWMKVVWVGREEILHVPDWAMSYLMYSDASNLTSEDKALVDEFVSQLAKRGLVLSSPTYKHEEFTPHPAFGKACATHTWSAYRYEKRFVAGVFNFEEVAK